MSGYNEETGIFELTGTKAEYWFRRKDIPQEMIQAADGRWDLLKRILEWQGCKVVRDGGNYLHVQATPEQLWEALSGQPSDPVRAGHYYRNRQSSTARNGEPAGGIVLTAPLPAEAEGLTISAWHELVWRALSKRAGWVYAQPLNAARTRKLTTYRVANDLAELERRGLVSLTLSKSKERYTVRLTDAGRAAVLAMPEDTFAEALKKNPWLWNANDIKKAKAKVSE